jgi:hypothetical protein
MKSRLEITSILFRIHLKILCLEYKRHETPRSFHILLIGVTESRSERSFLDGYAIGVGEDKTGETADKARPISERQSESKQAQECAAVGRMSDIAVPPSFN